MNPLGMALLLVASLGAFAYVVYDRLEPLFKAKADHTRTASVLERTRGLLVYGFGQKRMVDDPWPGLLHIFIFAGFMVVSLRTVTMVAWGFNTDFALPYLRGGSVAEGYGYCKDVINLLILVGCAGNLWRRLAKKPQRLTLSGEGQLILYWITLLVLSDLAFDASTILENPPTGTHPPLLTLSVRLLAPLSFRSLQTVAVVSFWTHVTAILAFLVYLPHGKHFHVLLSLPNILLRRTTPKGRLAPVKLDVEGVENPVFGTATAKDLTWKQMLDVYTCTECGRCTNACPAFNSGKPLSPKHISINLREMIREGKLDQKLPGPIIDPESLWSCTTCRACEEMCPVFIEYVDKIVDMRRELVLMESSFPAEVQNTFNGIERNGNPWNFSSEDRVHWAEGLSLTTMAQAEEKNQQIDVLFWVGCAGSYDDRNKKVSRSLVTLMQKAGLSFAILGKEETCNGDPARRIGNEYLYQNQVQINVATLNKYKGRIGRIVTACPHCFNTLANEYPDFGFSGVPVIHHSMLLEELLTAGKLKPQRDGANGVTVFHDPCYLGRYNDQYEPPRAVLDAIPGLERREVEQSRRFGRCCGAGGGRMFMEEKVGIRMNENRLADLKAAGPETIAVGCPFCMVMVNDAVNQTTPEGTKKIAVKDISEVLVERVT